MHNISHDLKNPVGRIQAYSSILETSTGSKQEEYIKNIQGDSSFVVSFIDTCLKYVEVGRSQCIKKNIDLNSTLQQSIHNLEMEILAKDGVINVSKNLPSIHGSYISLVELFQNLLSNAIKYSTEPPLINVYGKKTKESYIVSIADNGIGFPKDQANLFKKFSRGNNHSNISGLGIGLAIVKEVLNQHNAAIKVSKRKEGGSKVDITFPLETITFNSQPKF